VSTAATGAAGAGPRAGDEPVLDVRGLHVRTRHTELLSDVDLTIRRGERVGLIGESGSGKSLTALAVLGLLGEGLTATGGVHLAGTRATCWSAPRVGWRASVATTWPWSSRSR
jgi:peptide/nickel transport system ATP-binding protein